MIIANQCRWVRDVGNGAGLPLPITSGASTWVISLNYGKLSVVRKSPHISLSYTYVYVTYVKSTERKLKTKVFFYLNQSSLDHHLRSGIRSVVIQSNSCILFVMRRNGDERVVYRLVIQQRIKDLRFSVEGKSFYFPSYGSYFSR